jgi:hypothetical protein
LKAAAFAQDRPPICPHGERKVYRFGHASQRRRSKMHIQLICRTTGRIACAQAMLRTVVDETAHRENELVYHSDKSHEAVRRAPAL